jgi:hypothetical protein
VGIGRSLLVSLPRAAASVVIANPAIADVSAQTARSLNLIGKNGGGTTLSAFDGGGRLVFEARVIVIAGGDDSVTIRYGTGKNWVPGGSVAVVDCGPRNCSPASPLPSGSHDKPPAAK